MFENYIPNQYLRAVFVFVAVLLITRLILFILGKITIRLALKTKTDVDDKLISAISKPTTILAILFSLIFTMNEIALEEGVKLTLGRGIYSIGVTVLAYLIYVVLNVLFLRVLKKLAGKTKSSIDDSLISLLKSVLNITLIIISILYVLQVWGVQITPLLAGLGIAGLAVALAIQPILANIFSGASIILDGTIRENDLIYLNKETKGRILKVGLRSTRILTFDNELIIVPNTKLAESEIQNVALPEPKSRVVIPFGVAYGSNIEKVKKIILKEISSLQYLEKEPEPLVRFLEMAESSLNFKAYFYVTSFENRFSSIDEANTKIYNALKKNKISIPFPQMDVHLKKK